MNKFVYSVVLSTLVLKCISASALDPSIIMLDTSKAQLDGQVTVYYENTVRGSSHIKKGVAYKTRISGNLSGGHKKFAMLSTHNYQIVVGIQTSTFRQCYYYKPKAGLRGVIDIKGSKDNVLIKTLGLRAYNGGKPELYGSIKCPFNSRF